MYTLHGAGWGGDGERAERALFQTTSIKYIYLSSACAFKKYIHVPAPFWPKLAPLAQRTTKVYASIICPLFLNRIQIVIQEYFPFIFSTDNTLQCVSAELILAWLTFQNNE